MCQHFTFSSKHKSWARLRQQLEALDLRPKLLPSPRMAKKKSRKEDVFLFWTVAALIVTIVAVFANPDKDSLVDSEVLSLDGPVNATQNNKNQHKPKQNHQKKTQTRHQKHPKPPRRLSRKTNGETVKRSPGSHVLFDSKKWPSISLTWHK